jgi:hypothetical protein
MLGPPPLATGATQPRDLIRVAFGPSLLALVILTAITLVQLVVANSDLTGTLGAVASMWLAVHLVPVSIGGQQLGVLPLAPVALMVWATARSTARITPPTVSWLIGRWIVASAIGGPLVIAALCMAIVLDAASVLTELQTPNALQAFAWVIAVHGCGAAIGVGSRVGPRVLARFGLPRWLTETVRPAGIGLGVLLALSGAVVTASLIVHWGTMHALFGITDSVIGQASLTVLSLLYLPNVVIGAAAVAVGSSAHIGFATFSAFTVFGGDIPALPILAALPSPPLGPVWVGLLIIGATAGVALGQQCALRPQPPGIAVAKVATSALLAAAGLAVLAFAAGGPLGNFGRVGAEQLTLAPAALLWFFVVGGMTSVLAGGVRRPEPEAEPSAAQRRPPEPAADNTELPEERPDPEPAADGGGTDREPAAGTVAPGPADAEPVAPEPALAPPPVRPAPDVEDVEDLMFADSDRDPGFTAEGPAGRLAGG